MNMENIATQLLFTTVKVNTENSSGTGFFYFHHNEGEEKSAYPFLITNHHVIGSAKVILLELFEGKDGKPMLDRKINVEIDGEWARKYTFPNEDLAIIPIGPVLNQIDSSSKKVLLRSVDSSILPSSDVINELSALESVVFIGYPIGLVDKKTNLPILRQGITATPVWGDFDGRGSFLIDAGVFPGSSGSPLFILNEGSYSTKDGIAIGSRLLFLGCVGQTLKEGVDKNAAYVGLGRVIKSSVIKSLAESVVKSLG